MLRRLQLSALAFISTSTPASAHVRVTLDTSAYMLQCGFDTWEQCNFPRLAYAPKALNGKPGAHRAKYSGDLLLISFTPAERK